MNRSLLPSHRRDIEKAIDLAIADTFENKRSIENYPTGLDILTLDINPLSCKFEVLQILSYSYNVDITGLEDKQARRLVSKAFLLNKYKGTRFAVDQVVKALFPTASIEELTDEPFFFKIKICFNETDCFNPKNYNVLIRVVNSVKNGRSHLKGIDTVFDEILLNPAITKGTKYKIGINQNLEITASYNNLVSNCTFFKI